MSLRTKTLLVISVVLTLLFAILFAVVSRIFLDGFSQIEGREARDNGQRVLNVIDQEMKSLNTTVGDYSQWDDTCAYIQSHDPDFTDSNFPLSNFADLQIDAVIIADMQRNILYSQGVDYNYREFQPVSPQLLTLLIQDASPLWPTINQDSMGIVILPEGPMLVSARAILTSNNEGPMRGTFLIGRYLNDRKISEIEELTSLTLSIRSANDPQLPEDFKLARNNLRGSNLPEVRALDEERIAVYAFIADVSEAADSGLIVRVDTTRDVNKQAQISVGYLLIFMGVTGVVFCVAMLWLLERLVLARLARLSEDVTYIGLSGDSEARVAPVEGQDELSALAETINATLEALSRSHDRLMESEIQLRRITDSMSDLIIYIDLEGRIQYASPSHGWVLGYEPAHLLGYLQVDFIVPEDRESFVAWIQRVLSHGMPERLEFRVRHAADEELWLEANANVMVTEAGEVIGVAVSARDVTARKQAEDEIQRLNWILKRRARELAILNKAGRMMTSTLELKKVLDVVITETQTLFDAAGAWILLYDSVTEQLEYATVAGNGYEKLAGHRFPASVGIGGWVVRERKSVLINDVPNDPRFYDELDRLTGLTTHTMLSVPLLFQDTVNGVIVVVNKSTGELDGRDQELLEAVAAAAAVAIKNAQLYSNLELSLRQEQTTRAQLIQAGKLSAMGRMVASVAHELNNPLQTIKNCLFLLQQDMGPEMETNEFMLTVMAEIQRLSDLVSQLRAVYRPTTAEQSVELDLGALLEDVRGLVAPHMNKNRVQGDFLAPPIPLRIYGVGDQLKQVFLNIILNAVDAMQPAGGTLTVSWLLDDPGWVGVVFDDTGPGIDPGIIANLFEPFFTTKETGMGLGLAICYDIVQKHRGRIEVQNRIESGARFIVWLTQEGPAPAEEAGVDLQLERSNENGGKWNHSHR